MDYFLTIEQQAALDSQSDVPPRVHDPDTQQVLVLLRSQDFDWIRDHIPTVPEAIRATDARTNASYALVPEAEYERFKAFFEDDPITPQEQQAMLAALGKSIGWDDPAMDVYDRVYGKPS